MNGFMPCGLIAFFGVQKYGVLRSATQEYIDCEAAARKLQEGSDLLTTQVRLAVSTGEQQYVDAYFKEANVTKSREKAVEELSALYGDPDALQPLQDALDTSVALQQTEYHAMCLVEEAAGVPEEAWPEELKQIELTGYEKILCASATGLWSPSGGCGRFRPWPGPTTASTKKIGSGKCS